MAPRRKAPAAAKSKRRIKPTSKAPKLRLRLYLSAGELLYLQNCRLLHQYKPEMPRSLAGTWPLTFNGKKPPSTCLPLPPIIAPPPLDTTTQDNPRLRSIAEEEEEEEEEEDKDRLLIKKTRAFALYTAPST